MSTFFSAPLFLAAEVVAPGDSAPPTSLVPTQPVPQETAPTTQTTQGITLAPNDSPLSPVTNPSAEQDVTTTGRSFYVSTAGSNDADGSETNPWQSVQQAVSQLRAGDTLFIAEGVYRESVKLSTSGRSDAYITIQGVGNVVFDGSNMPVYGAAFDTQGYDYIRFKNLTVNKMRAAVEVTPGSDYIEIDGLKTDGNRFAVRITGGTNITVRNAYAVNSKNAFRASGGSRNLLFENIKTFGAKDIYVGMNPNYRNGDGFILERDVSNVTLRDIVSGDNWDAGIDCKANDVLIERAITFGNKNNLKLWGYNNVVRDSLSYGAKRQPRPDGSTVEGNGITVESGTTKLINVTFVDNEDHDVRIYPAGTLRMENSIVARRTSTSLGGELFGNSGGVFISENVLWYEAGKTPPRFATASPTDLWADPQFVDWVGGNYRLRQGSPAVNRGTANGLASKLDLDLKERVVSGRVDLGAYEFQDGVRPAPDPVPPPTPAPQPKPTPISQPNPKPLPSGTGLATFQGLTEGQKVGGKIFVSPKAELFPGLKKAVYYLNGKKVGLNEKSPFLLGGSLGFDTRRLADGAYTLKGVYTTSRGQRTSSIRFTVLNGILR